MCQAEPRCPRSTTPTEEEEKEWPARRSPWTPGHLPQMPQFSAGAERQGEVRSLPRRRQRPFPRGADHPGGACIPFTALGRSRQPIGWRRTPLSCGMSPCMTIGRYLRRMLRRVVSDSRRPVDLATVECSGCGMSARARAGSVSRHSRLTQTAYHGFVRNGMGPRTRRQVASATRLKRAEGHQRSVEPTRCGLVRADSACDAGGGDRRSSGGTGLR